MNSVTRHAHETRPLEGTREFLNRARLCLGSVCRSSNAAGLYRVPAMFTMGRDICDICAAGEPDAPTLTSETKPEAKDRPMEKTCSKCGDTKDIAQFNQRGPCKACKRLSFIAHRLRMKERRLHAEPVKPQPVKPAPANPLRDRLAAMVAAEVARVVPGLVAAELEKQLGAL